MIQELQEQRPETSKCSRLEETRITNQNPQRNRTAFQSRTAQNFNPNSYNEMTLGEYFRKKGQDNNIEQAEKKQNITHNAFFKEFQIIDSMRRTYVGDGKYMNMKQHLKKKIQDYDKGLFQKYANKFNLEMVLESELVFIYSQILIKLKKKISVTLVLANSQSQFQRLIQLIWKLNIQQLWTYFNLIKNNIQYLDQHNNNLLKCSVHIVNKYKYKITQIFDNSNLGQNFQKHYQANKYNILISEIQNKTGDIAI